MHITENIFLGLFVNLIIKTLTEIQLISLQVAILNQMFNGNSCLEIQVHDHFWMRTSGMYYLSLNFKHLAIGN